MFETNESDSFGLLEEDEFLNNIFTDETFNSVESGIQQSENLQPRDLNEIQTRGHQSELLQKLKLPLEPSLQPSRQNSYLNDPILQEYKPRDNYLDSSFGSKSNKRKSPTSPPSGKPKRERKFPGPAGLLPDRKSWRNTPTKIYSLLEEEKPSPEITSDDFCSQACSGSVLEEEPWQSLLSDLGSDQSILSEVNVASVKRKAAARCFVGRKLPFLAAVLHHIDNSSPDPCIILRDTTGEIHGTLHREVWEKFAGELVVGSVLVVKNVGLLSTGTTSRRHYLNITANNLVTIYSSSHDKCRKNWINPFVSQDFIKTIQDWRSLISPSVSIRSPSSTASPALFNSSFSNSPSGIIRLDRATPCSLKTNVNEIDQRLEPKALGTSSENQTPKRICPTFNQSRSILSKTNESPNLNAVQGNSSYLSKSKSNPTHSLGSSSTQSSKAFNFNPVILKPKKFTNIFPQTNSDRNQNNTSVTTPGSGMNSSMFVSSQSSQLTAEEQSVVESVFDGIDADSLFDDDF